MANSLDVSSTSQGAAAALVVATRAAVSRCSPRHCSHSYDRKGNTKVVEREGSEEVEHEKKNRALHPRVLADLGPPHRGIPRVRLPCALLKRKQEEKRMKEEERKTEEEQSKYFSQGSDRNPLPRFSGGNFVLPDDSGRSGFVEPDTAKAGRLMPVCLST